MGKIDGWGDNAETVFENFLSGDSVQTETVEFDFKDGQYPHYFIPVKYTEKKGDKVTYGPKTAGYVELWVEVRPSIMKVTTLTEKGYPDFSTADDSALPGEEFRLVDINYDGEPDLSLGTLFRTADYGINNMISEKFSNMCRNKIRKHLDLERLSLVDRAFILHRFANKNEGFKDVPREEDLPPVPDTHDTTKLTKALDDAEAFRKSVKGALKHREAFCFGSDENEQTLKGNYEAVLELSKIPLRTKELKTLLTKAEQRAADICRHLDSDKCSATDPMIIGQNVLYILRDLCTKGSLLAERFEIIEPSNTTIRV